MREMVNQRRADEATALVVEESRDSKQRKPASKLVAWCGTFAFVVVALLLLAAAIAPSAEIRQMPVEAMSFASRPSKLMYEAVPKGDFGAYKEYSVIHTDRSLNLMSAPFQEVMRDLNRLLKVTYNAHKVAIIPGSGTFGMEAVARQFATNEHVMVLRNGYFSYRWTEIFETGHIPTSHTVLKALPSPNHGGKVQYAPHPIERVVQRILQERPSVLFAPHVETSTGIILPDEYIRRVSDAIHQVGGLFVLDCIASGTVWIDMKDYGVDVVISAPQKGWTGPPCAALVQLSELATEKLTLDNDTSFSMSLMRWMNVMDAYDNGGFAYHTTPPTDALRAFQEVSVELLQFGLPQLKRAQLAMGLKAREMFESKGLTSVAASGYQAPAVLVYHSPSELTNLAIVSRFHEQGLQIAKGVPWMLDEPAGQHTFRIGLFGLDKLERIDETLSILEEALNEVVKEVE